MTRQGRKTRTIVPRVIHFKQDKNHAVVTVLFRNNKASTCYSEHCAENTEICIVLLLMSEELKFKSVQLAPFFP